MENNDGEIYDPKDDYIFKRIFGHKENIFINFVNSIFSDKNEKMVKSVIFLNNEITKDIIYGKQGRLDVKAILDDGEQINIEVQVEPGDDFRKRSLLYWSKMYGEQIKKNESYADLKRCICISVLDFNLFKGKDKFHTLVKALDMDDYDCVFPEFEIHFLEVEKIPNKDYDRMSLLEKWMLFLKAPTTNILEELAMQEPVIAEAKETLYYLSHNEKERAIYEARKKYELDARSSLRAKQREMARNFKDLGTSIDVIVKATGLSREEVEQL